MLHKQFRKNAKDDEIKWHCKTQEKIRRDVLVVDIETQKKWSHTEGTVKVNKDIIIGYATSLQQ